MFLFHIYKHAFLVLISVPYLIPYLDVIFLRHVHSPLEYWKQNSYDIYISRKTDLYMNIKVVSINAERINLCGRIRSNAKEIESESKEREEFETREEISRKVRGRIFLETLRQPLSDFIWKSQQVSPSSLFLCPFALSLSHVSSFSFFVSLRTRKISGHQPISLPILPPSPFTPFLRPTACNLDKYPLYWRYKCTRRDRKRNELVSERGAKISQNYSWIANPFFPIPRLFAVENERSSPVDLGSRYFIRISSLPSGGESSFSNFNAIEVEKYKTNWLYLYLSKVRTSWRESFVQNINCLWKFYDYFELCNYWHKFFTYIILSFLYNNYLSILVKRNYLTQQF